MLKNQVGFAPILLIIIAAAVAATAGGYVLLNKGVVSVPGAPGIALNANCKYNDPDLCKFYNNFKDSKEYSVNVTTSLKSQPKMNTLMEVSSTDKFHMAASENGKENYNVITIGDTTYTKDYSDNKWWKQVTPKQKEEMAKIKDEIDIKDTVEEDKTTYKKIGMETCGSRQCFKYQVINPDATDFTEYIYFDDSEYVLRKTRSEGKDGSVSDADYGYSGVNISAPSPTKEAKPDQIIIPTGEIPGVSEKELQDWKKEAEKAQKEIEFQPQQAPAAPQVPEPPVEDNLVPAEDFGAE